MIRLVAVDIDGTLIGKDLAIPPATRTAIQAARSRGVRFVIVTGRMYQSALPYAQELGLTDTPLIAYNGAMIKEFPSHKEIAHSPVPLETCRALAALCEARGYHLQAYVEDRLYTPDMGRTTQDYLTIARVEAHPVGSLFLWLQQPSTKLLIADQPHRIAEIQAVAKDLFGGVVDMAVSLPQFLEIVAKGVSKGASLARVAADLGIDRSEVMAIGDGMNDMSMLTWAGTGVAINHAPDALKKIATHVTVSGPGEGVTEALQRVRLV
jgi:Cof subfamily protein (haloacid dehalogenase superfamily)